jgi:putative ABC transport system permease protein
MIALAWRNLWRQPYRTVLTLLATAFACMVMVFLFALQVGTYTAMKNNSMSLFDGYAQVQVPGYLDDPGIRKSFAGAAALAKKIEAVSGVGVAAPRAQTFALLSKDSHSMAGMIVGVQPDIEPNVSRIAATVRKGRYLRADSAEIVLGEVLARNLGVTVGEKVTLLGMARDGSVAADVLRVAGLFSSGLKDLDRQLAEMPLARFEADFSMQGQVNALALSGKSLTGVTAALPAVRRLVEPDKLAVLSWGELEPGLKEAIELDASTSTLWYGALVIVVVAILLNTIFMAVLERTREFGILLAIGMRPEKAGRMVWLEILMMQGLGLALGIALGAAAAGWYGVHGLALPGAEGVFAQWGLPGLMYPRLTPLSLLGGPAVIAVLTALAGLFPYLRLRKLEPVTAMRAV